MSMQRVLLAAAAIAGLAGGLSAQQELRVISCGSDAEGQVPVQRAQIAEWQAAHPDHVVVQQDLPWGECQEASFDLAMSGDPPAVAYVGSRALKRLARNGLIRPFDLGDPALQGYEASVLATVRFDGKAWGLPRAFSTKALFWNRALFAQAGLDMPYGPQSWDEVLTAAKAISDSTEAAGFGMAAERFDNTMHQFLNWMYSNGGQLIDETGAIVFDSPEVVATLQFYRDLARYAQPDPLAYDRAALEPLFRAGQIGMYVNGGWGRAAAGDIDLGVGLIPGGPAGRPSTLLITDSLVVFEGTGVEPAAVDLVTYLTAPERQSVYDEAGGWTPIRQGPASRALIARDPSWAPFIVSVPAGGPEPLLVDYPEMQAIVIDAIREVITGNLAPADAATAAAEQLSALQR